MAAMFAAEFEPAERINRRRSPRAPVSFDAALGQGGLARALARTLCKVTDVSVHGARIQTYSTLHRGATIWLTLPDVGPVAADVMWSDDYTAGCQFHVPLETASFEKLAALNA